MIRLFPGNSLLFRRVIARPHISKSSLRSYCVTGYGTRRWFSNVSKGAFAETKVNEKNEATLDDNWEWIPPKNRKRNVEPEILIDTTDEEILVAESIAEAEDLLSQSSSDIANQLNVSEEVSNSSEFVSLDDVVSDLKAQGAFSLQDEDNKISSYDKVIIDTESEPGFSYVEDEDVVPLTRGKSLSIDEVIRIIDANAGFDLKAYSLSEQNMMGEYLVLASAKSTRHVRKIEREIKYYNKRRGLQLMPAMPPRRGTVRSEDWIAIDTGTIIINIFLTQVREDLDLDQYWDLEAQPYVSAHPTSNNQQQ